MEQLNELPLRVVDTTYMYNTTDNVYHFQQTYSHLERTVGEWGTHTRLNPPVLLIYLINRPQVLYPIEWRP